MVSTTEAHFDISLADLEKAPQEAVDEFMKQAALIRQLNEEVHQKVLSEGGFLRMVLSELRDAIQRAVTRGDDLRSVLQGFLSPEAGSRWFAHAGLTQISPDALASGPELAQVHAIAASAVKKSSLESKPAR